MRRIDWRRAVGLQWIILCGINVATDGPPIALQLISLLFLIIGTLLYCVEEET